MTNAYFVWSRLCLVDNLNLFFRSYSFIPHDFIFDDKL